MPDYVGILKRSIGALPDNDPALRQAVYERARSALARQLTGIDPPLSAEEIEVQHQHLEDAIQSVESELADGAAAAPAEEQEEAAEERDLTAAASPVPPPIVRQAGRSDEVVAAPPQPPPADEEVEPAPDEEAEPARPSRLPLMIMLALVALVLAGAAALAYTQWRTVETVYADLRDQIFGGQPAGQAETPAQEPPEVAAVEPPAAAEEPAPSVPPKSEERLPTDGNAAGPAEQAPGESEQAAREPSGEDATGETGPSADLGVPNIPSFNRPAAPEGTGDNATAGLVAQRAIFYEQGEEGSSGRASQGAISWERIELPQEPPGITARVDLPEQGVTVTLTFTRNTDPALPASHLIEIDVEGGLGGPIQRVPALVLKPSEQARGQALAGAAVPVTDRLFWIALSDDPDQVGRNLSLLRDGSWFDMPIMYEDGQRALLTFEKGIPGDRVFETVLAEWTEAQQRTEQR